MANSTARYRATTIAFEEMVVQVGKAIAKAQEEMDMAHLALRRRVAQEIREGGLRSFDARAPQYTIPETRLSLRIGLTMRVPEDGGQPTLEAVPLNATSTRDTDVDVAATTEIELRFVAVPRSSEPAGPPRSRMTRAELQALLDQDWLADARPAGASPYIEELSGERLWIATVLAGREPQWLVVVDDRSGQVLVALDIAQRPGPEELAQVGAPTLGAVSPARAPRGQIVQVTGDNLLTLAGQTTLELDGRPIPLLRHHLQSLAFKVPSWATRGDLALATPLGNALLEGAFVPLPSITAIEPRQGWFDSLRQRGTWSTITGSNLRYGCSVRFAGGAMARRVEIVSETQMRIEVPEAAESGPVTLTLAEHGHEMTLIEPFVMLPRIDRVEPRQAYVGATLTLSGNHLASVREVVLGQASVSAADFQVHTPSRIRLRVPSGATDGPLVARVQDAGGHTIDVTTRDIFYVVPSIVGFAPRIVVRGQLLRIHAEGLDTDPDMMTLLFDALGGISEAPVLSVASDRRSLTTRVPSDAVTGYVQLLRKRIYSGRSPDDTSYTSDNKLTVLTDQGAPVDVLLDERFDDDALGRWTPETGAWSVIAHQLACRGVGRLALAGFQAPSTLVVHGEILEAASFGLSFALAGTTDRWQLWIAISDTGASLTWSRLRQRGPLDVLTSTSLDLVPGGDHLLSLRIVPPPPGSILYQISVAIDQLEVHSHTRELPALVGFALLANGADQRWDNVVMLSRDVLALPAPGDYRFAEVPDLERLQVPVIASFSPESGGPGVQVEVSGTHLADVVRVFLGGLEAVLTVIEAERLVFTVPEQASSGPIEVHARGGVVVSSAQRFVVPPALLAVQPRSVSQGDVLHLIGTNLPGDASRFTVSVLGANAEILAASPALVSVVAPRVRGVGTVSLVYGSYQTQAPGDVEVWAETVALDLVARAPEAQWRTADGAVPFGTFRPPGQGSVRIDDEATLEDGKSYGPVLELEPPRSSSGALIGLFPELALPLASVELSLRLGFSAGQPGDRVIFEVSWLESDGTSLVIWPGTALYFDADLEAFAIPLLEELRQGRLMISIRGEGVLSTPPRVSIIAGRLAVRT